MYVSRVRSSGLLRFKINFWSYESIYTFRQHFLDGELVHHKACVFTGHDNTEKRRHTYIHVSSGIRTKNPLFDGAKAISALYRAAAGIGKLAILS
jgi:hypothetical protein